MSLQLIGLPHSEMSGSKVICTSPNLIAAYHVLLRLREPRHPPVALSYFFFFVLVFVCVSTSKPCSFSELILRLSFQYLMRLVRASSLSTLLLKTFNMSKIVESCDSWGELQLRTGLFHLFTLDHLSGIDNLASLREQLLYRPVLTASLCRTISSFFVGYCPLNNNIKKISMLLFRATTPERRCSSRTFRYGYLVTT